MQARMESTSVPGRLQIAPTTRDLLAAAYRFEARHLDVKGLGQMTAYLVTDPDELSARAEEA